MTAIQRSHLSLLALELVTIPIVTALFKWIPERQTAAVLAGTWFIVLGLVIVAWPGLVPSKRLQRWSFYLGGVHLLALAIPIMAMRLLHWGVPFDQISLGGIPGPIWHKTSTMVFLLMVSATLRDFLWLDRPVLKLKTK